MRLIYLRQPIQVQRLCVSDIDPNLWRKYDNDNNDNDNDNNNNNNNNNHVESTYTNQDFEKIAN